VLAAASKKQKMGGNLDFKRFLVVPIEFISQRYLAFASIPKGIVIFKDMSCWISLVNVYFKAL